MAGGTRSVIPFKPLSPHGVDKDLDKSSQQFA